MAAQAHLLVEGLLVFDDLDGHGLARVFPDALDHLAEGALPQKLLHLVPEQQHAVRLVPVCSKVYPMRVNPKYAHQVWSHPDRLWVLGGETLMLWLAGVGWY